MNKSFDYTCIFGGGAIRGVSYAGAVKAMEELGIDPKTIAGSSVGAIFAGLLAVGYNSDELEDVFMKVNFELFKDIHLGFGRDFALSKGEVFLEWVRDLIETKFYGESYKKGENPAVTFKDVDKNLVIVTTDLTNFKYKEFSKFETPDYEIASAIRISSTMPGLMKPVVYNNALLVDGDLQKSWPLWKLSKNLCPDEGRILEFRLEGDYEGKGSSAINFINTVYSCITSVATSFIIDRYAQKDKFDYVVINTGEVVVVDFNQSKSKRENLMQIGYDQTMDYFKNALPKKKAALLSEYLMLEKHLRKIYLLICGKKISKVENALGQLFMWFLETKCNIDKLYFKRIVAFKNTFINDVKPPSLFGQRQLRHHIRIENEFSEILDSVSAKVAELRDYKVL